MKSNQVIKNPVPTLCGYGLKDHLVPHDYLPFPNSNHGMYADHDVMQDLRIA